MSRVWRDAAAPFALLAFASMGVALIGLWVWPLGAGAIEPAVSNISAAAVLGLALVVGWYRPALGAGTAAGLGAFIGPALAWTITVAFDHREAGDGLLVSWLAWTALVAGAFTIGAASRWLAGRTRAIA